MKDGIAINIFLKESIKSQNNYIIYNRESDYMR